MNIEKILKEIEALIIIGENQLAERYLLQVMEKYPKHPEVHYLLGDVYCKLIKFDLAIEHLKIADTILPENSQILNALGWAFFMNGDLATGRKYMELALEITPEEIRLLCDLTVLETRAGNRKALEYAQKALQLDPNDALVQEVANRARLFIFAGDESKSKKKRSN